MTKRPPASAYMRQARAIQSFVNFPALPKGKRKAPKSLKDKVRKYFKLIYGSDGEPGLFNPATDVPVRRQSQKALKSIQAAEGQPFHKAIKVAFVETVPNPIDPTKLLVPRITVNRDGTVTKSNFDVSSTFYRFSTSLKSFLRRNDPDDDDILGYWAESEVSKVLRKAPTVRSFVVKCGKRQTNNPKSRSGILDYVQALLQKYDNAKEWLFGLVAYDYSDASDLREFLRARDTQRKQGKSKTKKAKQAKPRRKTKKAKQAKPRRKRR